MFVWRSVSFFNQIVRNTLALSLVYLAACGGEAAKHSNNVAGDTNDSTERPDLSAESQRAYFSDNLDPVRICEGVNASERRAILSRLHDFDLGERSVSAVELSRSPESCVLGLLPAALYTNLRTGVPASVLIAQMIQETGWCRSQLAKEGWNYHGQKAKFSASYFRYWDGSYIWINSSEDPSGGGGNKVPSKFMAFDHPDFSFYAVAERFRIPGLPYGKCLPLRRSSESFARCIGEHWAVHRGYGDLILGHRRNFRSPSRPSLRLANCDLLPDEWQLEDRF